jgi:dTDP-glucose 4,6-dehydratase
MLSEPKQTLLITGGAGFIGSTLVRQCLSRGFAVVTFDKLTYAGHRESLVEVLEDPAHLLIEGDIADGSLVTNVLHEHQPQAIIHLAAESHVDRSIADPPQFATTNVLGTCVLLEAATGYWQQLSSTAKSNFRFLNVSTDEVFGSAGPTQLFNEQSPLRPNSPYAASKAAGEHFAHAFNHTYGLPVVIANPSNNFGPRQHPEKFIPKMILAALRNEPLGIYGDGLHERDWLHVGDCCNALLAILDLGEIGKRYVVGADNCLPNLRVAEMICDIVDELTVDLDRRRLISHVADRPGHDRRYALEASFLKSQTSWRPRIDFPTGLRETVRWYLDNREWVDAVMN